MDSSKIAQISEQLLSHFAATGSMREAFDKVFGAGAYESVAGNIYDALRAKA